MKVNVISINKHFNAAKYNVCTKRQLSKDCRGIKPRTVKSIILYCNYFELSTIYELNVVGK